MERNRYPLVVEEMLLLYLEIGPFTSIEKIEKAIKDTGCFIVSCNNTIPTITIGAREPVSFYNLGFNLAKINAEK